MSDLKVVAHKIETPSGPRFWFDVQGPMDSCGHRHDTRLEAAFCKSLLIRRHNGDEAEAEPAELSGRGWSMERSA